MIKQHRFGLLKGGSESKAIIENASRTHTRYVNRAGQIVPGVTSVVNHIDGGEGLIPWANKLGLRGIDSAVYVDNAAKIGTLAHEMIHYYISTLDGGQSTPYSTDTYPESMAIHARNALAGFVSWYESIRADVVAILAREKQMVCDRYGGTCDLIIQTKTHGVMVIDYKTGTYIPKHVTSQLEAYAHLYELETGIEVDRLGVLHLDRDSDRKLFQDAPRSPRAWRIFDTALSMRNLMLEEGWA